MMCMIYPSLDIHDIFDVFEYVYLETWRSSSSENLSQRLRSLLWPGFEFTLTLGADTQFSKLYFGYGEKNVDLQFML